METLLADLMARYPRIRLARADDNQKILDFLKSTEMKTSDFSLRYDRSPDFFAMSRVQGQWQLIFVFLGNDDSLCGLGIFTLRRLRVKGKEEIVVYASDLRMANQAPRATRLQWRKLYAEILRQMPLIPEMRGARLMITSVFDQNRAAIESLVRKKTDSSDTRDFSYLPLFPYRSVNVYARFLGAGAGPLVQKARIEDEAELKSLLLNQNDETGFDLSEMELLRLQQQIGFRWVDFLVLRDDHGKISACALPWSDQAWRRIVVDALPRFYQVLGQSLGVLGRPQVRMGHALRISYLGFFRSRRDSSMRVLDQVEFLRAIWKLEGQRKRKDRSHLISLFDRQDSDLPRRLLRAGFACYTIPAHLYQVVPGQGGEEIHLSGTSVPAFEMGLA